MFKKRHSLTCKFRYNQALYFLVQGSTCICSNVLHTLFGSSMLPGVQTAHIHNKQERTQTGTSQKYAKQTTPKTYITCSNCSYKCIPARKHQKSIKISHNKYLSVSREFTLAQIHQATEYSNK